MLSGYVSNKKKKEKNGMFNKFDSLKEQTWLMASFSSSNLDNILELLRLYNKQNTYMKCDQMRFIYLLSLSYGSHISSIGIDMFASHW